MSTMKEDSGKERRANEGIRFSCRCGWVMSPGRFKSRLAVGKSERFEFWAWPEPFYFDKLYWTVSTAVAGGLGKNFVPGAI